MEQSKNTPPAQLDAIKILREIRDKLSLEIMDMTYEQERAYLDKILNSKKTETK